ncbi:hypothetical protein BKA82DRAFT_4017398 [Pisolithus tinctorius]|nr:hypothetical protein BKA82DRAFT_4017398 [Pisolithus tinctorius]
MWEWCPWKAAVQRVLGIPHPLNTDGWKAGNSVINAKYTKGGAYWQKAGNSLINGTYIQGAACEVWVTQISSDSCQNDVWKAGNSLINGTYIPGAAYMQKAGNSLITGTYTQGAACEVWDTQISSDSCQNDGQKAGNSLINGTYIQGAACEKAAVQRVLGTPHPLNTDEQKPGNSVINAKYTKGAACKIWVTQISSNSCQTGVHAKPLLSRC